MMAKKRHFMYMPAFYALALLFLFTFMAQETLGVTAPTNQSTISDSTPSFSWTWTDNATTNYTLVIDDSSDMASPILTVTDITDVSYTLDASEALPSDSIYYWHVLVYIEGIYSRTISYAYFHYDITPPVIVLYSPENMSWVNKSSKSITIITDEDSDCRYSTAPNVPWAAKTVFSGSSSLSHTATFSLTAQDINDFFIQCQDDSLNQINLSDEINFSLRLDSSGPVPGTLAIDGGAAYTNSTTVALSWSGFSDSYHGIQHYYYSTSNNAGSNSGTQVPNSTSSVSYVGLAAGTRNFYVWADDWLENYGSTAASASIIVDLTDPELSSWTESPSNLRYNSEGVFNISVEVVDTNVLSSNPPECRYRFMYGGAYNDSYTSWEDMTLYSGKTYWYAIDKDWGTYGGHYIYYECRAYDAANHTVNETYSEYIDLNENPPSFLGLSDLSGVEGINMSFTVTGSDVDDDTLSFGSDFGFGFKTVSDTSATAWIIPTNDMVGENTAEFYVSDEIYNISEEVAFTVVGANDAPVLDPVGNLEAYLHEPFLHVITAEDPDNQNQYLFDDDLNTFGNLANISWFRITSGYNSTTGNYYGMINFTPLTSHKGRLNITVTVTDGTETDSEEIVFTVGYCGDLDTADEPKCDSEYETCANCPEDCGACEDDSDSYMAIIVPEKNCVNKSFTLSTYELVERGTCETEGRVINGLEVCGNLSDVTITVYLLENKEWIELDEYTTDEDGLAMFIPTTPGSYKLTGTMRGYATTTRYLDFGECRTSFSDEDSDAGAGSADGEKNNTSESTESAAKAGKDKNITTEEPGEADTTLKEEIIENATLIETIIWYGVVPIIMLSLVATSFFYYQKNKDDVPWILKTRIFVYSQKKKVSDIAAGFLGKKKGPES